MNREDVLHAISRLNDAIASLNVRLHPPPPDPNVREELEAELDAAEQSRDALEQVLSNLPVPTPAPAFLAPAVMAMRSQQIRQQNDAAIAMSRKVREHADDLVDFADPVDDFEESDDVTEAKKANAGL